MNRRRFLAAAAGGLSATAGCLDALTEDTGTGPPGTGGTQSATPTTPATVRPTTTVVTTAIGSAATVGDIAATVTAAGIWRRTTRADTDRSVVAATDRQYLVFQLATAHAEPTEMGTTGTEAPDVTQSATSTPSARTTAPPPNPTDFSLALSLDGVTYTRVFPTESRGNGRGSFAVPVPAGIDASTGAVMWYAPDGTTVRWPLSPGHFDQLDRTPRFVLESFEATAGDDRIPVTLTVSNAGSRAGRFLAELRTQGTARGEHVSFGVPLDETVTYRTSAPVPRNDPEQVTVRLQWGGTVHERTVER